VVQAIAPSREMTFEAFEREFAGKRYEYVDGRPVPMGPELVGSKGEIIVSPTKPAHGLVLDEIEYWISQFVRQHRLGRVFGAETGFMMQLDPPIMRAADVAFISNDKARLVKPDEWLPFPPDLAVEVISEYEKASDVRRKTQEYMQHGTRLLWVFYPATRLIDVYRPGQPVITLGASDMLDGGDVLAGFAISVAELFAPLDALAGDSES